MPPAGEPAGAAEGAPDEAPEAIAAGMADPPALVQLCAAFGLSPFERDLLTLCAGVELDAAVAPLCAQAQGDPQRPYPTFSLALAALPGAHWSAVTPGAPLRHWQLIEVQAGSLPAGSPLTRSPLRVDERVLHFLAGTPSLDERLAGTVEAVPPPESLAPSHRALAERLASGWTRAPEGAPPPAVELWGASREARQAVAGAACALAGLRLYAIGAETLPAAPGEQESLCRLWAREAALGGAALLVECDAAGLRRRRPRGRRRAIRAPGAGRRSWSRPGSPCRRWEASAGALEVPRPAAAEQHALWRRALGPLAQTLNGQLTEVVMQFDLGLPEIDAAGLEVLEDAQARTARATDGAGQEAEGSDLGHRLWDACRAQARPRLDDLAQRLEPRAGWDDLVLPEPQRRVLREIAVHVRHRATVYERWGFGARGARGPGHRGAVRRAQRHRQDPGRRGAGRRAAPGPVPHRPRGRWSASTSARRRRTSAGCSTPPRRAARCCCSTRRTPCSASAARSRTATTATPTSRSGYLLQRMEAYRGLAILTTNMKSALDPAFLRRLRFVVQFPFPDAAQRAADLAPGLPRRRRRPQGLDAGRAGPPQRRRRQHPQHRPGRRLPGRRRRGAGADAPPAASRAGRVRQAGALPHRRRDPGWR